MSIAATLLFHLSSFRESFPRHLLFDVLNPIADSIKGFLGPGERYKYALPQISVQYSTNHKQVKAMLQMVVMISITSNVYYFACTTAES